MKELPPHNFLDGFYIWFDIENKKEYYSTPLYQYNTKCTGCFDDGKQIIKLEKSIKKGKPSKRTEALKYPAFISYPFEENIGSMLLKFLNADLSSFENAYDTFFYAYGFETLKEYAPYNGLQNNFENEIELLTILKKVFETSKCDLCVIQNDFKNFIDYIYNLNNNNELKESKPSSKFIAGIIKGKNNISSYTKEIEVILDNYTNKNIEYMDEKLDSLVKKLDLNDTFVKRKNVYTSSYLSSILFIILEHIALDENIQIKQCLNCGKYFIPISRQNEIYCDFENIDGSSTCRDKGATETYKKNLNSIPALLEYRRTYQKRIMIASRNKDNKQLRTDFDKWKKEAQSKIKLYKKGELSEEELYNWMIENKDK